VPEAKLYDIPKQLVLKGYQRVKANRGAADVDEVSLAAFEDTFTKSEARDQASQIEPERSRPGKGGCARRARQ
jgi:hypothetical protein